MPVTTLFFVRSISPRQMPRLPLVVGRILATASLSFPDASKTVDGGPLANRAPAFDTVVTGNLGTSGHLADLAERHRQSIEPSIVADLPQEHRLLKKGMIAEPNRDRPHCHRHFTLNE